MLFNAEMLFTLYQHLLQQILWISMHKKQIVPTELSQGFKHAVNQVQEETQTFVFAKFRLISFALSHAHTKNFTTREATVQTFVEGYLSSSASSPALWFFADHLIRSMIWSGAKFPKYENITVVCLHLCWYNCTHTQRWYKHGYQQEIARKTWITENIFVSPFYSHPSQMYWFKMQVAGEAVQGRGRPAIDLCTRSLGNEKRTGMLEADGFAP